MSVYVRAAGYRHPGCRDAAALMPLDLILRAGEQAAVIGPSGAGKTTLLQMLATALRPQQGAIRILDADPWQSSATARRQLRRQIGLIQQAPPLPPRQRVVTAVGAGRLGQQSALRALANLVYPSGSDEIGELLAQLKIGDKLFQRCDQLSGGQLQRVAIARTIYQQPRLILADEPVSAMDPRLSAHSLGLLQSFASRYQATLLVSLHAVDLALQLFPRVIGLRLGETVFDAAAETITDAMLSDLYASEQMTMPPQTGLLPCRAAVNYPCR